LALSLVATAGFSAEIKDYSSTIDIFKGIKSVEPFFADAYGFAVFPKIGKGGLGVGAAHGRGQVYVNDKVTGITKLTDISIGFQAGGQAYRQIIFFEDKRAYDEFTRGSYEFDAGAGAIAVTASAEASASTQGAGAGASSGGKGGAQAVAGYHKGLAVFTIATGGLMYEATIAGQKYKFEAI
jgi:lipid-binding SYLF domain-containing protein